MLGAFGINDMTGGVIWWLFKPGNFRSHINQLFTPRPNWAEVCTLWINDKAKLSFTSQEGALALFPTIITYGPAFPFLYARLYSLYLRFINLVSYIQKNYPAVSFISALRCKSSDFNVYRERKKVELRQMRNMSDWEMPLEINNSLLSSARSVWALFDFNAGVIYNSSTYV